MYQTNLAHIVSTALILAFGAISVPPVEADPGEGIEFRDMVGVNQGVVSRDKLWENSVGYNRNDVSWRSAQPNTSTTQQQIVDYIESRGGGLADDNAPNDVGFLPMLGYTPSWATDTSETTFETYADRTYRRRINDDGRVHFYGPGVNRTHGKSYGFQPMQEQYKDEWTSYVTTAVETLKPHGVEYYQPWNEPYPAAFFEGDPDLYMERVGLPAAKAIRDAGGKVVFGGWPTNTGFLNNYFSDLLSDHDAWDKYDALSVHYRRLPELESLRKEAVKHGVGDIGIWQTEMGNTQNLGRIPSYYPRFAKWALLHNDGDPDRYKSFWFPQSSFRLIPPDHTERFRGVGLFDQENDNRLSDHGTALKVLGDALSGEGKLALYDAVENDRGLTYELNEEQNGIESFKIDDRIVVAVHLERSESDNPMELYFPELELEDIADAQWLAMDGRTLDLTVLENIEGEGVMLEAPTDDTGFGGGGWPSGRLDFARTFLVQVVLVPEPSSVGVLGLGVLGLALLRRRARR